MFTIVEPITADLDVVNSIIHRELHSRVPLVNQIADYIIKSGGKRIRPILLLLTANACGYRGTYHHLLAAVIELIHTAGLLHDDVVDESSLRRGRQTTNALFGNADSVLVGDFVYSRAFQMMASTGNVRVMQIVADTTNMIAEGEVLQSASMHNQDLTEERYYQVVHAKTSKLFETSAELGAIIAGASEKEIRACAEYGHSLGTAFQLVDDMLDYSGSTSDLGKNVGDDLREGKLTLPLIYLLQHGTPQQTQLVRIAVENGDASNFDEILTAITKCGALDYTRHHAALAAQRATSAITALANNQFKDSLLKLSAFVVDRNH